MATKSKPVTNLTPDTVPVLFLPHILGIEEFAGFIFCGKYTVFPGANTVPIEIWEQMKTHPFTRHRIEASALREADPSLEEDKIDWIKGTWELPTLRSMAQTEVSTVVQEEIAAQIQRLVAAKFPSTWRNVAGECKSDWLVQTGPRIWQSAYSLPTQFDLQHNQFRHYQNRPVPA